MSSDHTYREYMELFADHDPAKVSAELSRAMTKLIEADNWPHVADGLTKLKLMAGWSFMDHKRRFGNV